MANEIQRAAIDRNAPFHGSSETRSHKQPSWLASALGSLGRGGRNLAALGAITAVSAGFLMAPAPAYADYLRPNANNVYELVRSELSTPVIPAQIAGENADQIRALESSSGMSERELSAYPLFVKLWQEITNVGEFEIAPAHMGKIIEYATTHNLAGAPLAQLTLVGPEGTKAISEGNRALVQHLLAHPYYGAFIEQEARPLLEAAFALPVENVEIRPGSRPVDAGELDLASIPAWQGSTYTGNQVATLHTDLASEFRLNAGWYEGGSKEQSAQRLTALLLHFGRAIHMHQQVDAMPNAIVAVSDTFHQLPIFRGDSEKARFLRQFFATDYNGSGMGLAESIIRGFDPNNLPTRFADASNKAESTTSLSMTATGFKEPLTLIDAYRTAIGMEPGAVDRFVYSVHNTVIGGIKGNNKTTLDERKPFASLVNFGVVLEFGGSGTFARDSQAAQLLPKPGFEFPIDVVDATGVSVSGGGTTLRVYEQRADGRAGDRVSVEKVIHNDEAGKPQYWTAVFRNAAGAEVPADKVIGLLERGGRAIGDGLANQTLDSGYWGYCDLNTGQTITGAIHRIPKLDVEGPVYIMAGDTLMTVPKDRAQEIVNMGVADSAPRTQFAGFRHDRDASVVRWLRGTTLITDYGQLQGTSLDPRGYPRSAIQWGLEDQLTINFGANGAKNAGVVRIQTSSGAESINAGSINRVIRGLNGDVTVVYDNHSTKTGKLITPLAIDWTAGKMVAGESATDGGTSFSVASPAYVMKGDDTLDRIYRREVKPKGVSYEAFKEANAELFARANSLRDGTQVKIPKPLSEIYETQAAPAGVSLADFQAANAALYARAQPVAYDGEKVKIPQLVIQNDPAHPFTGELVLKTVRGTEEIFPAGQLQSVSGESEHDIRFTYFMRFVINSEGIYATDASTGASVSNGARYVNNIDLVVERGAGRPAWADKEALRGVYGPVVRQPGDHIVFAAGTYGESNSTAWKGWYQVNERGQIINEGWISGMPDTAWGGLGNLDWTKRSSFVSELPPEMRVKLFVNGRKELRDNTPEADALARRLNLPSNWREYITPTDRIPVQEPIATAPTNVP